MRLSPDACQRPDMTIYALLHVQQQGTHLMVVEDGELEVGQPVGALRDFPLPVVVPVQRMRRSVLTDCWACQTGPDESCALGGEPI